LAWLRSDTSAPSASASSERLTGGSFGWIPAAHRGGYIYLSVEDAAGAAGQFSRYGILDEGELPGTGDDRINGVTFECDLLVMLEKMLDGGFTDPPKEIAAWLLVLQHCSKRLAEELLKVRGEEGPPPRF
jgi:hypothetical protein